MIKLLTPANITFDNNYVYVSFEGDDTITYTVEKNKFEKETGLTISNLKMPVPVYLISLSRFATSSEEENSIIATGNTELNCGDIIDNLFLSLETKLENVIFVIDFDGIDKVTENFCKHYMQYLLTTKNKVITINQSINVSNIFGYYVLGNIELQELE